jgi:hypothetical protein
MSDTIFTLDLADWLKDLAQAEWKAGWGLQTIQIGTLKQMPAPTQISSWIPALLIEPVAVRCAEGRDDVGDEALEQIQKYPFNVHYVRQFAPGEDVAIVSIQRMNAIAEKLNEDTGMANGPALSNGQVLYLRVLSIDYDPPEANMFLLWRGYNLTISTLSLEIDVFTNLGG